MSAFIELKTVQDFWASKPGHLGEQIMAMIGEGVPGFVAVLGSVDEVLDAAPKVGRHGKRSGQDIASDLSTCRALCDDAVACNVPIHFFSSRQALAFQWMLGYAKGILQGPNMAAWLPRFPVDPAGYGMLCSIRGIGHEAALALLQAYGGVEQIVNTARFDIDTLADTPVNGKRLGAAKAGLIARAVGV